MTLKEITKSDWKKGLAIANVIFDGIEPHGMQVGSLMKFLNKGNHNVTIEKEDEKTIDELVFSINRQIKLPDVPKTLKNRFYRWKHTYIKKLISIGKIERILESGMYYHFYTKNGHDFHQMKVQFPDGFSNICGTEDYVPNVPDGKFNLDEYKRCMIQLIMFS